MNFKVNLDLKNRQNHRFNSIFISFFSFKPAFL